MVCLATGLCPCGGGASFGDPTALGAGALGAVARTVAVTPAAQAPESPHPACFPSHPGFLCGYCQGPPHPSPQFNEQESVKMPFLVPTQVSKEEP